jgi:hypothetical protein
MTTIRTEVIGPFRVHVERFDEYNDYSVAYQHYVTVTHAEVPPRIRRWEIGRSERRAHEAFNRACTVIKHELGLEYCAGLALRRDVIDVAWPGSAEGSTMIDR